MSDEIQPALTPEEWESKGFADEDAVVERSSDSIAMSQEFWNGFWDTARVRTERLHAVAALALHGQPFGFTREDVALLAGLAAENTHHDRGAYLDVYLHAAEWQRLASVVSRIAALLPPDAKVP